MLYHVGPSDADAADDDYWGDEEGDESEGELETDPVIEVEAQFDL